MAPPPPLNPPRPEAPGGRPPARPRSVLPDEMVPGPEAAEIVLAKLRGMIASGRQEKETILGTVAVAAHALTGASGAAIAMPRDGVVVCVGRSGEIAPDLGDRLSVDSGISGECLRTGRMMRCDDAARDFHVNAEICREMGIQSIAVIPLRERRGRVGVLEAFSSQSYAFTDEHMSLLGRLAGLAEAAWVQTPETQAFEAVAGEPIEEDFGTDLRSADLRAADLRAANARVDDFASEDVLTHDLPAEDLRPSDPPVKGWVQPVALTADTRLPAPAVAPSTNTVGAMTAWVHTAIHGQRKWRYPTIVGMSAVLLILLAILGWKIWYKASLPVSSDRSASGAQEGSGNSDSTVGAGSAEVASTGIRSAGAPDGNTAVSHPQTARATNSNLALQPPEVVVRRKPSAARLPDRSRANTAVQSDTGAAVADALPTPISSNATPNLESLVSPAASLPKLGVPISQGVSGGVLVHKVLPSYPSAARQTHLQGTVVLEGTVSEGGQVEDLRVVSGPAVLTEAAMDAVRKWRYTPYTLNGKPIRKQTLINISFISPR
jgi:TonB family protein